MKLPSFKITRDTICFVGGLAGLAHQTLIASAEKPTLIIAFVGMLGLPLFIRGDEARRSDAKEALDQAKQIIEKSKESNG